MLDKILELTIDGQKQDLFTNPADTLKEIQKVILKHQDKISVSVEIKTFFTNSDIRETLEEYDRNNWGFTCQMNYDRWAETIRTEAETKENFLNTCKK